MPHASPAPSAIKVEPFPTLKTSPSPLGATVHNADLTALTEADKAALREALYNHHLLLFKNQSHLPPKTQYEVTQLFDPTATTYGHGKTLDTKRSILHPDLKTIPHQPQVQIIGHGHVDEFEGLKDFNLRHPHHRTFHGDAISDEEDREFTRFYRWHIDAALYDLDPPMATTLLAVKVPKTEYQTLRYDDGTGDELKVPRGSTVFASGEAMYDLLSEEDKKFVRETKVVYAPHPYVWMSSAKSRSTGLGMISQGLELPDSELPPIEESKIKTLPMCWKNPVTGKLALQVHPSAVQKLC